MSSSVTADYLTKELRAAEKALEENELQQLAAEASEHEQATVTTRLARLERATDDLLLAEELAEWSRQQQASSEDDLLDDCRRCQSLAHLLCRHAKGPLHAQLVDEDYQPLFEYLQGAIIYDVRQLLRNNNYPDDPFDDPVELSRLVSLAEWLYQLQVAHEQLVQHVGQTMSVDKEDSLLVEICRPFVERIRYHFIDKSDDRVTSSKIDRLPEWLFAYLRDHLFESAAWELIDHLAITLSETVGSDLRIDVVNETIRLVQWVFGERHFFRHPKVAGPDSKPLLLCNAVEQLLGFDDYVQELVGRDKRVLKLMDIFVTGDDELLQWWLERERESVFAALFDDKIDHDKLVNRVSPRAELFCSLIRSVQSKASVFTFSGPYLNHVAAPLCMQFLDAVHESASRLRDGLVKRKVPSDEHLQGNVDEWIELINGTHTAAQIMLPAEHDDDDDTTETLGADQDLARFGRSLQSLEQVLLEEFATTFVETLLMERAKLAGYIMRCSTMLIADSEDDNELGGVMSLSHSISPDLRETERLLKRFVAVCDDTSALEAFAETEQARAKETAQYAPRLMQEYVFDKLADKLMEVAMNCDGMTPELSPYGSSIFARDIDQLIGKALVPPSVLRLLDCANVMALEATQLAQIGDALCGLAGLPAPITIVAFVVDERLYDEAMSMIRAKGYSWVELEDVLNVLNRRSDLISGP